MDRPDDEKKNRLFQSSAPIDRFFYSLETGGMFRSCTRCSQSLMAGDEKSGSYLIYKIYGVNDLSAEFAICHECVEEAMGMLSEESRQSLQRFFEERSIMDYLFSRMSACMTSGFQLSEAIDSCFVCSSSLQRPGTCHTVVSKCSGTTMDCMPYPMSLCDKCEEDLNQRLSQKTRDEWDRFFESLFIDPRPGAANAPPFKSPPIFV